MKTCLNNESNSTKGPSFLSGLVSGSVSWGAYLRPNLKLPREYCGPLPLSAFEVQPHSGRLLNLFQQMVWWRFCPRVKTSSSWPIPVQRTKSRSTISKKYNCEWVENHKFRCKFFILNGLAILQLQQYTFLSYVLIVATISLEWVK